MKTIIRIITLVLMLIYMANLNACAEGTSIFNKPKARISNHKGKYKRTAHSFTRNVKKFNRCNMMGRRNKSTETYL